MMWPGLGGARGQPGPARHRGQPGVQQRERGERGLGRDQRHQEEEGGDLHAAQAATRLCPASQTFF